MSTTNPVSIIDLIQFCESHTLPWAGSAQQIGLTNAQVAQYTAATQEAREAYELVRNLKQQLRAQVLTQGEKVRALRRTNSNLLRDIRAFALQQEKPDGVYALAQIPAPAAPAPVGPPAAPTELTAGLAIPEGGIEVRWKATQPSGITGVVYKLERALSAGGPFVVVGLTGSKNAIDTTIPAGTSAVVYRVIAQRGSEVSGGDVTLTIRFGTGPGELAYVPALAAPRIAA
jgi:biotin carboxyl carrier protein